MEKKYDVTRLLLRGDLRESAPRFAQGEEQLCNGVQTDTPRITRGNKNNRV